MITAGLPTYNNADIVWLQLESLCAQVNAPEWELIMIEEPSEKTFGIEGLKKFKARLNKANCKRIVYIGLSDWIPLAKKWEIIGQHMSEESTGMMLCASDNYSFPTRVKDSYEAMIEGYDWRQNNSGYFYNILDHEAGQFNGVEGKPGLFMCISADKLKAFKPSEYPKKGVDGWLFHGAQVERVKYDGMCEGIHTDGLNTISHERRLLYKENGNDLITKTDENQVFALFPKKIQTKLTKIRNEHSAN